MRDGDEIEIRPVVRAMNDAEARAPARHGCAFRAARTTVVLSCLLHVRAMRGGIGIDSRAGGVRNGKALQQHRDENHDAEQAAAFAS
jgi:hypothetical protein